MTCYHIHTFKILFMVILSCAAVACSGTKNTNIERATEYNYTQYNFEEGHPELRISATGFLNEENEGMISVAADIENRSLIFRERQGRSAADIEIMITIIGTDGNNYLDSHRTIKTIENESNNFITISGVTRYERDMKIPPGNYKVFFSVTDKASDSETIREIYTFIPDPGENIVNLTSVQLLGKDSDQERQGYEPVTTYDVSTQKDSLRFAVQVTNNRSEKPLVVRSRLLRFEADTSVARSASHPNYSASSLPYRGIEYRNEETLDQTQRILDQPGSVIIEFFYESPGRGSYRFEVTADESNEEEPLYKARDFSVKGEYFPRVKSPRELAEPLVYLMSEDEHKELMSIEDDQELKEAVDRFWLSNIRSINRAKHVIFRYYERVEEANRQFTSFKEGWKTDRGMIYILFGPPVRTEEWLNGQQWLGSRETRDTRYNFLFKRTRIQSDYFPFDNYILQRHQNYHTYQYQQIKLWRTGRILEATM
jgi:GWxTD domain-containing protein